MTKIIVPVLLLLFVGLIILINTVFVVDETNQVIITQFGEYIRTIQEPGLYTRIPFIQSIIYFEKRVLAYDATAARYYTGDQKRVVVDHITRWRISNPKEFYISVATEDAAISRLSDIIPGRLREEIARYDFLDLVREKREFIVDTVSEEVNELAQEYGITIIDTRIKRLDLPGEVERSVFDRMESERERMAMRYRAEGEEEAQAIRAEADKEKEIILAGAYEKSQTLRGEGDALATEIYAEAYERNPEFYSFLQRLETYRDIIPGSTLVLTSDSDLFKFMTSPALRD